MAKIKIYQSQLGAKTVNVPQIGSALALPFGLATQRGSSFEKLGQAIKDAKDRRQETQDQNDARKINNEINLDLLKIFDSYQFSDNTDDVENFNNSVSFNNYKKKLKKHKANKRVKELVGNNLYTKSRDLSEKLYLKISATHLRETLDGHREDLNRIETMMGSPDFHTSLRGYDEKDSFFNTPSIKEKYNDVDWKNLKRATELNAKEIQLINGAKNRGATSTLEEQEEIIKVFGAKRAEIILDKVKNIALSNLLTKDLAEERLELATQTEQITNYQTVLERLLNKDDPDYQSKLPTLDDLNDLWKAGELNTAQYQSLTDYYVKGDIEGGNQEVLNAVLYQITIAENVDDLDEINRQVHFNPEWVAHLSLKEKKSFAASFNKNKENREIWSDYKYYKNQLDNTMGNVEGFVSKYDRNRAEELSIATSAAMEYETHIGNGMRPDDAYLKVLRQYAGTNHLPKLSHLPQLQNYSLPKLTEAINKDPLNAFQKIEDHLAKLAGEDKISMSALREDIDRLDVIKDLHQLRQKILGENDLNKPKGGTDEG